MFRIQPASVCFAVLAFAISPCAAQTYTITTVAGGALPVGIPGPVASLYGPQSGIAADAAGNVFFVDGNTILRLDAVTGILTLVAGNGSSGYTGDNGPAVNAQLHAPSGIALDSAGNLYIACSWDNVIREVSRGNIATIAGTGVAGFSGDNGLAADAELNAPYGIALDAVGNLFIADYGNNRIREISGGVISTIAGNGAQGFSGDNGPAPAAQLNAPHAVAVDGSGNLYIADSGNNRIREVSGGIIGTIAGNGTAGFGGDGGAGPAAELNLPSGIALDAAGNLYIADYYNDRIRLLSAGTITTAAGTGAPGFSGDGLVATKALLNNPLVLAFDQKGNLYFADSGNNRIREVSGGVISTIAGNGSAGYGGDNGTAAGAQLHFPYGAAPDSAGDVYVADFQNNRIREVSANGVVTTVAGNGLAGFGGDGGAAVSASLNQPAAVAMDGAGNLYIADSGNHRVRRISAGTITTLAGDGQAGYSGDNGSATGAELNTPYGVAVDASGNVYVADTANNRVRKVSGTTITTVAGKGTAGYSGDGGSAVNAQLNQPGGVAVDSSGNLYIADTGNNRVRKVAGGTISTVAGSGTPGFSGDGAAATGAKLNAPAGVATGAASSLYIADTGNNAIRRVAGGSGAAIATIAGMGVWLGDNGPALSAELGAPRGVSVDSAGDVFVADTGDNRIRQLTPQPLAITGPASLPGGTVGSVYSGASFTASGGDGGYTWKATGLPAGFALSTAGALTGTPTAAATSNVQFTVTDSGANMVSVTLVLAVVAPVPAIAGVSPASATAGGAGFTLTVTGSGFLTGATIQWDGAPLVTKVVSATQLTAAVAASLIANPANLTVLVNSGGNFSGGVVFPINPPTPVLTSISPTSATATGAAFTLTATGKSFVSTSQIEWGGSAVDTTFVSATKLTALVPASAIGSAGSAAVLVNSGSVSSSALTFTINAPPAITTLSPASVTAYGAAFTLTLTGTGFVSGDAAQWNGTALATKYVSATQMTASVPASLIGGAGSAAIVVSAGGIVSNSLPMTINPQPPAITSLVPASVIATSPAATLTVNGTGFMQSDTVEWNGAALPTNFVSATQLTAYVASSLIASAGSAAIVVSAGAGSSAASTFTIGAPPAITTLSPTSVVAGGAAFTLTVSGSGFVQGAQVEWNGAALPTTFVSTARLTAAIGAGMIGATGNVTIQVGYGGASSAGVAFAINGPPTITGLSPASATAGGAAFTLTVSGSGFALGAAVTWNGTALTTKFVSATQVTASVAASLIGSGGGVLVAVNSGGAATNTLAFPINAPPAIASLSPASVSGSGAPFTLTVNGSGFLSGAVVEWNGTALTTTYTSATQLTAQVPANTAAGTGTAPIVAANPDGSSSAAVKITLTAAVPSVTAGGVVPIYSSIPVIQPGSWVSIYGSGLAGGTYLWTGNFPTSLGGTSVKIDGKPAYLWSVSPTQINLQAPADTTTGTVNVVVTTSAGSMTSSVTLAAFGPSFSLLPASSYAAGVILTPDGSGTYGSGVYDLAGPAGAFTFHTRPVKPGETLELFGVGFGPTNPAVAPGKAYTGSAPTTNNVAVTIGGVPATVLFAGMTEAGVYQLNVTVPQVVAGDQPLVATVSGIATPTGVLITVQ